MSETSQPATDVEAALGARYVASKSGLELPKVWRQTPLTVVIPTYNEAENLAAVIRAVTELPLDGLSILVVDDNSPDGTGCLAEELAKSFNSAQTRTDRTGRMGVLHRTRKDGLGRAYIAGMTHALEEGAEYVLQMDADGSHPHTVIPAMLGTALATGADIIVGSRYVTSGSIDTEWSWHRKLLSAFANLYVNRILGTRIRDVTAGFNLWKRSTLTAIDLETVRGSAYSFQVEMKYRAVRHGFLFVEIPIHFTERAAGRSKMNFAVQLESAWMPWRLRFTRYESDHLD